VEQPGVLATLSR